MHTGSTAGATTPSPRSRGVALALAVLLGPFGGHRFYVGKVRSGALMCATLGGLGIWYLYDLILVSAGSFRDAEGRLVSRWDPEYELTAVPSEALLEEVDALRAEVAELTERVEFAERLLAQPRAPAEPSAFRS
ncbi:MAG TPA: TM2 domain-containing protein [Gemmatimonadales bacterium]|nr:TM2 domain-containing protein [Gemmatimonadales bacterium]